MRLNLTQVPATIHETSLNCRVQYESGDIYLRKYEHFPEYYRAANLAQGHWTAPYFDCHGLVKKWKITYAAPFFGWDSLRKRIEFK